MGWWLLRLSAKILAVLRILVIKFFCFKELNINKPVFLCILLKSKIYVLGSSRDKKFQQLIDPTFKVLHFKYYFTHRNVNSSFKKNLREKAKADTRVPNSRPGRDIQL